MQTHDMPRFFLFCPPTHLKSVRWSPSQMAGVQVISAVMAINRAMKCSSATRSSNFFGFLPPARVKEPLSEDKGLISFLHSQIQEASTMSFGGLAQLGFPGQQSLNLKSLALEPATHWGHTLKDLYVYLNTIPVYHPGQGKGAHLRCHRGHGRCNEVPEESSMHSLGFRDFGVLMLLHMHVKESLVLLLLQVD